MILTHLLLSDRTVSAIVLLHYVHGKYNINMYTVATAEAQVSAVASFNDSRCAGQMVCSNDPLLFTCTVTRSTVSAARVTLPSRVGVQVTSTTMVELVGAPLPDGVTVVSHNAIVDGGLVNYTLTLAIERASLLGGNPIICDDRALSPLTDEASCPIATGSYSTIM